MGITTSVIGAATSALFAQICPVEVFENANAWRSTSVQAFAAIGPYLGGLIIVATGGATLAFAIAAASIFTFLVALLRIPRPADPKRVQQTELRAGLRFVFGSQLLLPAITLDLFAVLLAGSIALLPVYARDILHVGADGLGGLRLAPSVGATLMAFVTTRLPPWKRAGRVLLVTVAGFALATIGFGLSRSYWLSWTMLLLTGAFDNVSAIIRMTLEQVVTPDALRGRVAAVHNVFIGLSNEMGEFESGLTAWAFGPVASVVGGAVAALAVIGIVAWRWPALRRLGRMADLRQQ
jgi:MFS family permease